MKAIRTFQDMRQLVFDASRQLQIAAVCPTDQATQEAIDQVEQMKLAKVIRIYNTQPEQAAEDAVGLIRKGEADVIMKGLISTDILLRAILNKVTGLLPQGKVLSHIAVAEIPNYRKLLFFSDAAVIPYPTQEQRITQIRYTTSICHQLGIEEPRIALIHCAEHGGKQFPFVDGYNDIKQMAADHAFGPCIIDGPMDVKTACSLEAMQAKGIVSPVNGEADVLIMPDIEAGNTFYKSLTLFANSHNAGILWGAKCPVVIPSRGDSAEDKFNSILFALACL